MCLNIHTRKWKIHKNILRAQVCRGCLFTQGYLYIFSYGGVERRITNNDYAPWERVQTNLRFHSYIKSYQVPNENNQFYLFGRETTSIITINDDYIQQQKIGTHN